MTNIVNTDFVPMQVGTKMTLRKEFAFQYIEKSKTRMAFENTQDHALRLAQMEARNIVYSNPVTVAEHKLADLEDRKAEVIYIDELPNVVHLAHHFKVVKNE